MNKNISTTLNRLPVLLLLTGMASFTHANVIPDASFENGKNWISADYASSLVNSPTRTGSKAVKLINDGAAKGHNFGQYNIGGVTPNQEYVYTVWVRGNNVQGVGNGGKPLSVTRWRNSASNKIAKEMYMWAPYNTYDWRPMFIHIQAPANAAKVDSSFRSWYDCLSGTTYWDDVSLVPRTFPNRGNLLDSYQAENANTKSGGSVHNEESDFTGSGYFDVTNNGAVLQWNNVTGGGARILSVRYAYEGNARNMTLYINGVSQGAKKPVLTGRRGSWASMDWNVDLPSGGNTVRLQIGKTGGINSQPQIDKIDVYASSGGGGGGGGNQAPSIASIGQQNVEEGQTLSFTVTASDTDGPAPLTLTASNMPAGASFTDNGNGNGTFSWTPGSGAAANSPYSVKFKATDGAGASGTRSATINVSTPGGGGGGGGGSQQPYLGSPAAIPGVIEVENYDLGGKGVAYNDKTAGNTGGKYRTDDVDIWNNASEGFYTGSNAKGEWLEYTANVASAGNYTLEIRYSTKKDGRSVHVEFDGVDVTGPVALPNTGAWTAWQTVSVPVTLAAGEQVMRLAIDETGVNLNSINISSGGGGGGGPQAPVLAPIGAKTVEEGSTLKFTVKGTDDEGPAGLVFGASGLPQSATFTDNKNGTATFKWTPGSGSAGIYNVTFTVTDESGIGQSDSEVVPITVTQVAAGQQPYGGTPHPVPGVIEMENYDLGGEGVAYHDTSAGNTGGKYRNDDVDIWLTGGEGHYTGANTKGEWLEFTVDVASAGNHTLQIRYATAKDGRQIHIEYNGVDVTGDITLPNTGAWNVWQTVNVPVTLNAGQQVMRVFIKNSGINLNSINVIK